MGLLQALGDSYGFCNAYKLGLCAWAFDRLRGATKHVVLSLSLYPCVACEASAWQLLMRYLARAKHI